jgi:magnesium-transporting ATPase (P-type)
MMFEVSRLAQLLLPGVMAQPTRQSQATDQGFQILLNTAIISWVIFGFLMIFLVIYPMVLFRTRRLMPTTIYGWCLGVYLGIALLLVFVAYQERLYFGPRDRGYSFWPWWLFIVIIVLAFGLPILLIRPRRRKSLPTTEKS